MAATIRSTEATVESMPSAIPAMMTVAGPVSDWPASFLTGE